MEAQCGNEASPLGERAGQYRVLASFFMDIPSAESLGAVEAQLEGAEECASPGLRELIAFFSEAGGADERLADVSVDRTFLVRGTTKKGPRPPYGSLHADADPQTSMLALKARYREAGFDLAQRVHEAPDYLGVELAFMAALLERAARADADEAARLDALGDSFLRAFALPLARSYVPEARGFARTGYCRGMLSLVEEVLEAECARADARAS